MLRYHLHVHSCLHEFHKLHKVSNKILNMCEGV